MNYYYLEFHRFNELMTESVWVLLETKMDYDNCDLTKFDKAAWKALYEQYPHWECKYNSKNLPKTKFEKLKSYWSSPLQAGFPMIRVDYTTKIVKLLDTK